MTTRGNSAFQAARVPFQPSVLTVLGAYSGATSRASSLKTAVGGLQVVGPRRQGRLRSQDASAADGRGDVDLLAVERLVMLVGQQVLGQLRLADGGPHDAASAQPALQAIPGHRVAAEDAGQGPERDAELAQEQRAFDVARRGRSCRA